MNATIQGLLTDEVVLEELFSASNESPLGKLRQILMGGLTKRAHLLDTFNKTTFPTQYHTGVQNDAHEYLGLLTNHLKLPGHYVQSCSSIQCKACMYKWECGVEDLYGLNVVLPLPAPGERRVGELQVQSLVNEYSLGDMIDATCAACERSSGAQMQACLKTKAIRGELPVKTLSVCVQRFQFCQEEVEEVIAAGTQQEQGQELSPLTHSVSAGGEEEAGEGGAYDFVLAVGLCVCVCSLLLFQSPTMSVLLFLPTAAEGDLERRQGEQQKDPVSSGLRRSRRIASVTAEKATGGDRRILNSTHVMFESQLHVPSSVVCSFTGAGVNEKVPYTLTAIVVYIRGTDLNCGHYVAYCAFGDEWLLFDDGKNPEFVTWEVVKQQHAYILFYKHSNATEAISESRLQVQLLQEEQAAALKEMRRKAAGVGRGAGTGADAGEKKKNGMRRKTRERLAAEAAARKKNRKAAAGSVKSKKANGGGAELNLAKKQGCGFSFQPGLACPRFGCPFCVFKCSQLCAWICSCLQVPKEGTIVLCDYCKVDSEHHLGCGDLEGVSAVPNEYFYGKLCCPNGRGDGTEIVFLSPYFSFLSFSPLLCFQIFLQLIEYLALTS